MVNSPIEQDFINWCKMVHPDINPYIFIQRYSRYSEDYLPLIEEELTNLHHVIREKKPNIDFSLRGRIKSKRSFFIKTFITIAKNINDIFSSSMDVTKKDECINTYFKFLRKSNPEKFQEIKNIIYAVSPAVGTLESFSLIFNKLSPDEQAKLISRLGRTEDTFAYRPVIRSTDFDISDVQKNDDGSFVVIDKDGNKAPILVAQKIDPKKDIIIKDNGIAHINIDGKIKKLNERNLVYPENISIADRNLENAELDEDGYATLLNDSIILGNGEELNIVSIEYNSRTKAIHITDSNGDYRNLTAILQKGNARLRKYDEDSIIEELYDIEDIIKDYYEAHDIKTIANRHKDYVENPKPVSEYMSIHDSAYHQKYGYTIECQIRSQKMEDDGKDESSKVGHDAYKKHRLEEYKKNPILAKILGNDPTAFDSSTPTLMKILENHNVELFEILGKYISTTSLNNGLSKSYQPSIDIIFHHTFANANAFANNCITESGLNFSSYKDFISSRKAIKNSIEQESHLPDLYDD